MQDFIESGVSLLMVQEVVEIFKGQLWSSLGLGGSKT